MKKKFLFISFAFGTAFMYCCGQHPAPKTETPAVSVKKDTAKPVKKEVVKIYDRSFDDVSRFIAGMPQNTGSTVPAALSSSSVWKKYAGESDAEWEKVNANRLKKMKDWAEKELKTEHDKKLDLFYPFSGPDILHALALFPNSKNYYLFALEKCGSLPKLSEMDSSMTKNYLGSVNNSLQDIFNKSYFITRKMMNDLSKPNVNGTLPLICVFLARTENEVLEIKYYHIDDDGSLKETTADTLKTAVKVDFRKKGGTQVQSVYYFKTNFGDQFLAKNTGMLAFLAKMDSCNTYLKSASYLLHYGTFSIIRNIVLKKSRSVLEDDTGIPYKSFPSKVWKVFIYGKYTEPVKDFSGVYQTDLKLRYDKDSTKQALPFSLGYHWGDKNQNLLRAIRN